MLRVPISRVPPSLDGPNSVGAREAARAMAFFGQTVNQNTSFSFEAYSGADVKLVMAEDFHGKCAYCESRYAASQPVDVEHYRPKGGYLRDNRLMKPGYYWLAADWMNLLPSCIDCNRARTQEFPDEPDQLSGKGNRFPIASETRRATAPGQEQRERALLLHPRLDDPREHLEFYGEGEVRPRRGPGGRASRKAIESIRVYGLRRIALIEERARRSLEVEGLIENITWMHAELVAGNAAIGVRRDREVEKLRIYMEPDATYAEQTRQRAEPVLAALGL
jgi:uncharacterized protein (TIGR02646 family)